MMRGEKIREYRQKAGFSQETLAEAMNVSRQAVAKWESGQSAPSSANLLRLAELLHVPSAELSADDKEPVPAGTKQSSHAAHLAGIVMTILGAAGQLLIWLTSTTQERHVPLEDEAGYRIDRYTYLTFVNDMHLEVVAVFLWCLLVIGAILWACACRRDQKQSSV